MSSDNPVLQKFPLSGFEHYASLPINEEILAMDIVESTVLVLSESGVWALSSEKDWKELFK